LRSPDHERPHQVALRYLGVPFRHRGRNPAVALDCVGLLVVVAHELGEEVRDVRLYGREPTAQLLGQVLRDHLGEPKPAGANLEIDDLVVLQLPGQPRDGHAGIVCPHPYGFGIVHSYAEVGRVVLQRIDARRRAQIREVYRWPSKL
jgi:hypothetical protein